MTPPDDIREDVPAGMTCEQCGYLLTGLATDGRCPECGRGIRSSMRALPVPEPSPRCPRCGKLLPCSCGWSDERERHRIERSRRRLDRADRVFVVLAVVFMVLAVVALIVMASF